MQATNIASVVTHEGKVLDSVKGYDVIDCKRCGFKHIIPIPSAEELEKIYRNDYFTKERPSYIDRHLEDTEWLSLVYDERYKVFEQHLRFSGPDRPRILEIGPGPGIFLVRGQERGWDTVGIEPSAQAAARIRKIGLQVVETYLTKDSALELGKFDAVHMNEVLEHMPDPAEVLGLVHRLLRPDGLLCVAVPNDYNPFQTALREERGFAPWWVAPPHEINYFDLQSLERLLARTGFEVIDRDATFPIDLFLLMGDNYVGNDELGRACHRKRMKMEQTLNAAGLTELKKKWYHSMCSIGLGRLVILYGRRLP
jgi:SAM-dependent methyltransferase